MAMSSTTTTNATWAQPVATGTQAAPPKVLLPRVRNVFSVDVEDYFQVTAFEGVFSRPEWGRLQQRVYGNTMRILELLDRHNTVATFFVLGWIAENHPRVVSAIARAGHEIASHGYWHRLIHQQSPDEFRGDLRRSKAILEAIVQKPVVAYRAPTFSIVKKTLWALDILTEEGFTVDSSIFPSPHCRNSIAGFKPEVQSFQTSSGAITEFPMPVVSCLGQTIPAGGGGYFRLYPYWLTRRFIHQVNAAGQPFMFYVHPWEVDPEQPRVRKGVSWSTRFRHYVNLSRTIGKLDRLLTDFEFAPMSSIVQAHQSRQERLNHEYC